MPEAEQRSLAAQLREVQRALNEAAQEEEAALEMFQRARLRRLLAASAVLSVQTRIIDALRVV